MLNAKPSVRQRFRAWLDKHKTIRSALQFVAFVVFLVVLFLIVTLPLLPIMWPNRTWLEGFQGVWLLVMVWYVGVLVLAGLLSQHRHPLGMLITKENRLSFSRLQMLCWWVMLVSALVVVAGARLQYGWLTPTNQCDLEECKANARKWESLSIKVEGAGEALDKGDVPEKLREEFSGKGKALTAQMTVKVNAEGRGWTIIDGTNYYFLQSEPPSIVAYKLDQHCAELNMRSYFADTGWLNGLNIVIPDGLLLAAGLSIGAAAVKSSINGVKRNPSAKQARELDAQATLLKEQLLYEAVEANRMPTGADTLNVTDEMKDLSATLTVLEERHGFLMVADDPAVDHFVRGSEVFNWEDLDWSKVQALLLTAVLIVLYGIALWRMLSAADTRLMSETVSLPDFSGALAALLTVSLGGYAGYQAVNHSTVDTASVKSLRERTTDMDKEAPGATSVGRVNKTGSRITSYVSGSTFDLGQYDPGADFSDKRVVFKVSQNGKSAETVSALDS